MRVLILLVIASGVLAEGTVFTITSDNPNEDFDKRIRRDNSLQVNVNKTYKPDWKDLDSRPLPEWYDKAKIGIFLHWGVYSVPGFVSEWFWRYWKGGDYQKLIEEFMQKNYPPNFTYQDFAHQFTAEFFDPGQWADLFSKSGAKYVVLTTKHHEGFALFPSERSFSWNAMDIGPKRDLVGDLSKAIRNKGMKFGAYYSLFEWFNPMYVADESSKFKNRVYPDTKLWPELKQLINDYKPSLIWSDGDGGAYDDYWHAPDFLAWLYNESPVKDEVVVNDRWGIGNMCHHGGFYTCADRYNPGVLQEHKWENAFTVDGPSWGYRRNMRISDILSLHDMLVQVVSTVSCGGNVLINVGPSKEGTIVPIFQERLLALGEWLNVNGEAIYGSSPWKRQNDTINGNVWYTCTNTKYNTDHPTAGPSESDEVTAIYAMTLEWPGDKVLKIRDVKSLLENGYKVELLGNPTNNITYNIVKDDVHIQLPDISEVKSKDAWTLKFTKK